MDGSRLFAREPLAIDPHGGGQWRDSRRHNSAESTSGAAAGPGCMAMPECNCPFHVKVRPVERKLGRSVFYHLRQPEIAAWVLDGLRFIGPAQQELVEFQSAVKKVRRVWS